MPAILVRPGAVPAGRVVDSPVGLIDLARTLVELAGLPVPRTFEGTNLLPLIRGKASAPPYVFMEAGYDPQLHQLAIRQGTWKLIHVASPNHRKMMTGNEYELYDLEKDPGELNNIAEQHPDMVRSLLKAMTDWHTGAAGVPKPGEEVNLDALDENTLELLRSLGYVDSPH